jgi:hypothetical protein
MKDGIINKDGFVLARLEFRLILGMFGQETWDVK